MKKLLTICFLLATIFSVNAQAQNAPLNKQQTLDYIEKLFKANYESSDNLKITEFKLDGKILSWKSNVAGIRVDLSKINALKIINSKDNFGNLIYGVSTDDINNPQYIVTWIRVDSDAKKLKKALEHLIEILKTEKSTDPFGE